MKRITKLIVIAAIVASMILSACYFMFGATFVDNDCLMLDGQIDIEYCNNCFFANGLQGLCGQKSCVCRQTLQPNCICEIEQNGKYGLCGKNPCVCRHTIRFG